ncbi:hypothetical protein NS303_06435 [Pantoea ananatis]|nr:hypothetical protein NS303_06435 [Pantoea ananatis]KTR57506.1 hypothetical protein NS311_04200 [Pantoea ananatis]KTR65844.1 hypothetical protein RSA47_07340 [Pantoea ananatis]KTR71194.1 hypothetical protein NS296_08700 [Pantoea ananatis]
MHLIMVFLRIRHSIVCFGNNKSPAEPKKMRSESQIHIEILLATAWRRIDRKVIPISIFNLLFYNVKLIAYPESLNVICFT